MTSKGQDHTHGNANGGTVKRIDNYRTRELAKTQLK